MGCVMGSGVMPSLPESDPYTFTIIFAGEQNLSPRTPFVVDQKTFQQIFQTASKVLSDYARDHQGGDFVPAAESPPEIIQEMLQNLEQSFSSLNLQFSYETIWVSKCTSTPHWEHILRVSDPNGTRAFALGQRAEEGAKHSKAAMQILT
mmetsp:Transcript_30718/g.56136  ORF Transcript_30718/g.56136 Transcript_30718/m.56136 type:complete len:149 (+) Transcript_30718:117-563(+)